MLISEKRCTIDIKDALAFDRVRCCKSVMVDTLIFITNPNKLNKIYFHKNSILINIKTSDDGEGLIIEHI